MEEELRSRSKPLRIIAIVLKNKKQRSYVAVTP